MSQPSWVQACPLAGTQRKRSIWAVCRALTPDRAGCASCTTLILQCVAIPRYWQRLRGEREGQINLHRQTWMGHKTLKRNVCVYNQRDRNTGESLCAVHTHTHTDCPNSIEKASCAHLNVSSANHGWLCLRRPTSTQADPETRVSHITCWRNVHVHTSQAKLFIGVCFHLRWLISKAHHTHTYTRSPRTHAWGD